MKAGFLQYVYSFKTSFLLCLRNLIWAISDCQGSNPMQVDKSRTIPSNWKREKHEGGVGEGGFSGEINHGDTI